MSDFGFPSANDCRVSYSANSFASRLHSKLAELGVKVDLYARAYRIRIRSGHSVGVRGSKFTEGQHHRSESKILFSWDGGTQVRKWVDYAHNDDPDAWVDLDNWCFAQEFGSIAA